MPDVLSKTSEVSLGIAFFTTLFNLLYLEPKSTKVMFDRYSLEDDGKKESEEYSKLAKSFGKLHGMSSLANLVSLVSTNCYSFSIRIQHTNVAPPIASVEESCMGLGWLLGCISM